VTDCSSFSGAVKVGDRVVVDPGGDWGRSWGEVLALMSDDRLHIRLDSGGKIIVPAGVCWGER